MTDSTTDVPSPRRGGNHPYHGIYMGGCGLNDRYELVRDKPYKFTAQLRNVKQMATNEQRLIDARVDSKITKVDGNLEVTKAESNELDTAVKDQVSFYGLQNFFYLPGPDGVMTSLLGDTHSFTLHNVLDEYRARLITPEKITKEDGTETKESALARYRAYDEFELYDIALSRLAIEALITAPLREKVAIRFSHIDDFEDLPGQIYFMMILDVCHASEAMDIDGAIDEFRSLSLSDFPGENVSALATKALKLIKIMNRAYAMDVKTGSSLIKKVTNTSSDYFNRNMYNHLDNAKRLEDKYRLKDPRLLKEDDEYGEYGPIGICGILQEEYGRLFADKEWPALRPTIPEGNLAPKFQDEEAKVKKRKCFYCGDDDHIKRDCPKLKAKKGTGTSETEIPDHLSRNAWKYIHPANENQILEHYGKTWKFCKKCVYKYTKKTEVLPSYSYYV